MEILGVNVETQIRKWLNIGRFKLNEFTHRDYDSEEEQSCVYYNAFYKQWFSWDVIKQDMSFEFETELINSTKRNLEFTKEDVIKTIV